MGKKESFSVPASLQSVEDLLKVIEAGQRSAILDLVSSGELSAEDAITQIKELARSTFEAKYLGSVPVAAAKLTATMWSMFGNQVISSASPKLKALKKKPVDVTLSVSSAGIQVINKENAEQVQDEPLNQVVFCSVDAEDKKRFGYLTHYGAVGLIYCHLFQMKDKVDVVVKTINEFAATKNVSPASERAEADKLERATGATLGIFEVNLLGSVPVVINPGEKKKSEDVVTATIAELKARAEEQKKKDKKAKQHAERLVLVLSSEGLKGVEQEGRELLVHIFLQNVQHYMDVSGKKEQLFSVICKDDRLNKRTCYIFQCEKGEATKICEKMKEAFKVAKEDQAAREGNPFIPMSGSSEVVKGPLADHQLIRKNLKPIKALGAGQFGEVYLASQVVEDSTSVMRAVKMLRGGASALDKDQFLKEAETMLVMTHPNLVRIAGVCAQQRPWLCVLEFVRFGDLCQILETCKEQKLAMTFTEQLHFAMQISSGLAFMASKQYVHLDVAARNCLVHTGNVVKVADFGLARKYDEGKKSFLMRELMKLSIRWVCIEAMGAPPKLFTEQSDVWSFAVLLWEIFMYGERPYSIPLNEIPRFVLQGGRLPQPPNCPPDLYKVMLKCWAPRASDRYSFNELGDILRGYFEASSKKDGPVRLIGEAINGVEVDTFTTSESSSDDDDQPRPITMRLDFEDLIGEYDTPHS